MCILSRNNKLLNGPSVPSTSSEQTAFDEIHLASLSEVLNVITAYTRYPYLVLIPYLATKINICFSTLDV
jgi:hypothetical protein